MGSINGVSDTQFAPDKLITRQEAATMLINTYQMGTSITSYIWADIYYKDVDLIAPWAKDAVDICYDNYIMRGNGDYFNPNDYLTREQAIHILSGLFEHNGYYSVLRAKGVVRMDSFLQETGYVVGKDYVYVKYSDREDLKESADWLFRHWRQMQRTSHVTNPSFDQVRIAYQYRDILLTNGLPIEVALEEEKAQLDYTYMKVSFWEDDYLIKFDLSPKKGYVSKAGNYCYGNPKIVIEAKKID